MLEEKSKHAEVFICQLLLDMKKSLRDIHAELFADYVLECLERTGISRAELARRAKVSPQVISQIANKKPHGLTGKLILPERETVDRIAKAFGDPPSKARAAAGYSKGDDSADTVEETLDSALFFDRKGLSEADRATLRPLLQVADREVERLLSPTHDKSFETRTPTATIQSSVRQRDKIDEWLDSARTFGGGPIPERDRQTIREVIEKRNAEKPKQST